MTRHRAPALTAAGLALLLAGCASTGPGAGATAARPAAGGGARPCDAGEDPAAGACYDPEALMRSNRHFRDRIDPQPADLADARGALEPVRVALTPVAASPTVDSVTRALRAAGWPRATGVASSAVIGVPAGGTGVSVPFGSACVYGDVTAGAVTLDVGGVTEEGSCLPGVGGH